MKSSRVDPSSLIGMESLFAEPSELDMSALAAFETDLRGPSGFAEEIKTFDNVAARRAPEQNLYPARWSPSQVDSELRSEYRAFGNTRESFRPPAPRNSSPELITGPSNRFEARQEANRFDNTDEQRKSQIAQSVIGSLRKVPEFDMTIENEADEKALMLDEIDILVEILKDADIDISRTTLPTQSSTLKEISDVRNSLRLKNDRQRSTTLAVETILALSQGLEYVFDGKKAYFGVTPDLTGYTSTVNVKMRNMRYDTSSFVNGIMRSQNYGPGTRLLIELVPSMILYCRMKKNKHGDNIYTSSQMNAAIDRIRDVKG